ncbi:hypothetical protein [Romboutsia ilealis]|uniref:hypothetical protein n=1 Tax=Romboutsia ilealis TaxID=1115758 RepID=UPI0025727233|nr:hypothetical protein [Romboutsia ilealis]
MKNSEDYEYILNQIVKNTGLSKKICTKYLEKNNFDIEKTFKEIHDKINSGQIEATGGMSSGIIYGNISNASTIYGMDKFNTPRGHGFAAEYTNHLYDKINKGDLHGNIKLTGEEIDPNTGRIVKNGADRIVDGIKIQTKYCASGSKCISECFDNGKLKYLNSDGTPMQIEVPSDKYDAAVKAMENRIKNGEVPGISDPSKANDIVRKGHFTYEQAKNITRFGTIESIEFDAVNGAIIATGAMGISTVLTFATSIWNGEDFDIALKNAAYSGLKVGGTTFATAVLSSQLSRAGLNSALVGSSEAIVSLMGPKASAMLVNAFRSGGNIYGAAAMKSAAKMLRGNAITGAVSVIVLSSFDVANIFRGRISGSQLFKNVANTASTVAGGTAGWVGGASAGAAIGLAIPIVGAAIGGVVGGILGSFAGGAAAGKVSGAVLNEFIEDDANKMVKIVEEVFTQLAEDYVLNKKEAENIIDKLQDKLTGKLLKDMFASSDRNRFAKNILEPLVEDEAKKRKRIEIPTDLQLAKGLREVLEDLSDAQASIQ